MAVLAAGLAACGSERPVTPTTAPTGSAPSGSGPTGTVPDGTVPDLPSNPSQSIGKPKVSLPTSTPLKLAVTDLRPGTGATAVKGSTVVLYYVGVRSATGQEFDSNYGQDPLTVTLGTQSVIEGWEQGLLGAQAGMRRQLDIPNELAYGKSDRGDVIKSGDALSFVVDVLAVIPPTTAGDAPTISPAKTANVTAVRTTDLVPGRGAAWTRGAYGIAHIVAISAADGKVLDSSWEKSAPETLRLGELLPGMDRGLAGMKVGGRRQLQIPFAEAFGAAGNPNLGLPASTDLILVVDLLAVY